MVKTLTQLEIEWGNSKCGKSSEQFIYDYFMEVIPTTKLAHYVLLQEENERLKLKILDLEERVDELQYSLALSDNTVTIKESNAIIKELLRAIYHGERELKITYQRHTPYKGGSSLWLMQEMLEKYKSYRDEL